MVIFHFKTYFQNLNQKYIIWNNLKLQSWKKTQINICFDVVDRTTLSAQDKLFAFSWLNNNWEEINEKAEF